MEIFKDIYTFIGCLSLVDIVFLFAIVTLLILVVVLIYFIRINQDVFEEEQIVETSSKPVLEEIKEMVSEEEPLKIENHMYGEYNDEEAELIDLESLTKKLKEEENTDRVNCTEYEKDQEEKAIISYDEILQKKNKYAINYEKEEIIDDLIVKKVNLNDLENKNKEEVINAEVRVISYQKEEAFLSALKELNSILN